MSSPKTTFAQDAKRAIADYKALRKAQAVELRDAKLRYDSSIRKITSQHKLQIKEFMAKISRQQAMKIRRMQQDFQTVFDWKNIGRRPDPLSLVKKGYFVADCHMHSNYSDGVMTVEDILSRARELKLNIAVTDHDEIKGSLKALEKAARYGVNVLPGIEASSKEGKHFLFYFLDENEMKRFYANELRGRLYRPTSQLLEVKPDYSTIMVWAHPKGIYPWQSHTPDFNTHSLDGMEAYNSWGLSKNIREVYAWARKEKRFSIGSSDAHMIREIGNVVTYTRARSFEGFFNQLERRHARIIGRDVNYLMNMMTYGVKYVFTRKPATS